MHKIYLYLALALIVALPLRADLTVVVAINGLNETALKEMQPFWPQGGLRWLSEEAYQTSVRFDHWMYGGSESLVTLLTGVNPCEHGICSDAFFDRDTRQTLSIWEGDKNMAIGGGKAYSASALLSPTIADRLRLRYGNNTHIYAIGLEPEATMALASHAANGCCWLAPSAKDDSLRWVSTSYYKEGLPNVADEQNMSGELSKTLNKVWTPRMEMPMYLHPTSDEKKHGFKYSLLPSTYYLLPSFNTAVINLALALQADKQLGKGATPDMLLLQLTALTPEYGCAPLSSAQQEDMYLCLNQDLGYLLEQLQKKVGRESLRVVVVGVPKPGKESPIRKDWNMPLKELSVEKVTALTSTYLMALYGHERWIDGGWGHALYLNKTLIEQKHLSLETIRRQVAEFLMEFDGIRFACPVSQAYLNEDMAPSLYKRFAGDVVFTLQPNFILSNPSTSENTLLPPTNYQLPVIIWSGDHRPFPPTIHQATEIANYIL